jgi:CBS domain-containing protein
MSAGRTCSRVVVTVRPDETVRDAARQMAEHAVGSLVVVAVDGTTRAVGMITDRDIAIRCVAARRHPDETLVSEIMSAPVQSVDEHTPIAEALSHMAGAGTRRLVVTGANKEAVGILSMDDVLDLLIEETTEIGRLLSKQAPHVHS